MLLTLPLWQFYQEASNGQHMYHAGEPERFIFLQTELYQT
jgi:hypothetical protein